MAAQSRILLPRIQQQRNRKLSFCSFYEVRGQTCVCARRVGVFRRWEGATNTDVPDRTQSDWCTTRAQIVPRMWSAAATTHTHIAASHNWSFHQALFSGSPHLLLSLSERTGFICKLPVFSLYVCVCHHSSTPTHKRLHTYTPAHKAGIQLLFIQVAIPFNRTANSLGDQIWRRQGQTVKHWQTAKVT